MSKKNKLLYKYHSYSLYTTDNCEHFVICNSNTDATLGFPLDATGELKSFIEEYFHIDNYRGILRFGGVGRFNRISGGLYNKYINLMNKYKIESNFLACDELKGLTRVFNHIIKKYKPNSRRHKDNIISIIKEIKQINNKKEVI